MKRHLFRLLSAVSLVLALIVVALWARSMKVADVCASDAQWPTRLNGVRAARSREFGLISARGHVRVSLTEYTAALAHNSINVHFSRRAHFSRNQYPVDPVWPQRSFGFVPSRTVRSSVFEQTDRIVLFPYWLLTLAMSSPALICIVMTIHSRKKTLTRVVVVRTI